MTTKYANPDIQRQVMAALKRSEGRCERVFQFGKGMGRGLFRCKRKVGTEPYWKDGQPFFLCTFCHKWAEDYPAEAFKNLKF